jgi:hypothetical protein
VSGRPHPLAFPVVAFLAVATVLVLDVWWSVQLLGSFDAGTPGPDAFPGAGILRGWFHFDGGWYRTIFTEGYSYHGPDVPSTVAFFPAYPLAMRVVGLVVSEPIVAGMVVTFASGLGATCLLHRWSADRFGERTARVTVLVLLLYPFSYYLFGAVYPQALYLVAALGAFVLLERDHTVLAGLVGAVASATRPEGIAIVVGLVAVLVHKRSRSGTPLRPGDAGVLLSAAGVGAWCAYLWARFGDPLLFATVQQAWAAEQGPATWFKLPLFDRVAQVPGWVGDVLAGTTAHDPDPWARLAFTATLVLHAALLVAAVALTVVVFRRLGWGYGLYTAVALAIPVIGSENLHGMGRFALAAFPCFAVAGDLLVRHRSVARVWLPASGVLLVFLTSAFARGHFLA